MDELVDIIRLDLLGRRNTAIQDFKKLHFLIVHAIYLYNYNNN